MLYRPHRFCQTGIYGSRALSGLWKTDLSLSRTLASALKREIKRQLIEPFPLYLCSKFFIDKISSIRSNFRIILILGRGRDICWRKWSWGCSAACGNQWNFNRTNKWFSFTCSCCWFCFCPFRFSQWWSIRYTSWNDERTSCFCKCYRWFLQSSCQSCSSTYIRGLFIWRSTTGNLFFHIQRNQKRS